MRVHVAFWTDEVRADLRDKVGNICRYALTFEIRAKQVKQAFNCCSPGLFDDCLQLEHLVDVVEDGEGGDEGDVHHPVVDLEKIFMINFANLDEKKLESENFQYDKITLKLNKK